MDDLIKALQILRKYGNPQWPTHCEHDVMYVNIRYSEVDDNEKEELMNLGFIKDIDNDGFRSYKFGSC